MLHMSVVALQKNILKKKKEKRKKDIHTCFQDILCIQYIRSHCSKIWV